MSEEEVIATAIHNGLNPHWQIGGLAGMHPSQQAELLSAARAAIAALDKHRADNAVKPLQPRQLSPDEVLAHNAGRVGSVLGAR